VRNPEPRTWNPEPRTWNKDPRLPPPSRVEKEIILPRQERMQKTPSLAGPGKAQNSGLPSGMGSRRSPPDLGETPSRVLGEASSGLQADVCNEKE
jgi:hypothetical protein